MATESVPFSSTATVGVWIDAGSRYETAQTSGAAHFLEHMFFKGTGRRSQKDLELEVEDMGGHLNAYTSREQTAYYAKVRGRDVPRAVDLLADMLQNSKLEASTIERERDVILREAQEIEGVPYEVALDHLHATAFQGSPLSRTILGPAESVKALSRDDLAAYIARNYAAPRVVVAAAGDVDHDDLVKLAGEAFAALPAEGPSAAALAAAEPSTFVGSEVRLRDPDLGALHWTLAYRGAAWTDKDAVALQVLQALLGSWDAAGSAGADAASPLAPLVAANGLATSFSAFNTNYADTGLFGLYATAEAGDDAPHDDLAYAVMDSITGLAYRIDDDDAQRAKNAALAALLFAADGTTGLAEELGRGLLVYGRHVPRAELAARINALTAADLRGAAKRFFVDQPIASAALGDTQFLPDYNWLARRTYFLRY